MELNLNSLLYLFFRLAPFILVCFFVLGSIINSELKGFVYLIGLVFACFVSSQIIGLLGETSGSDISPVCNLFTINGFFTNMTPISMVVLTYTFFYLVYPIGKYHLEIDNVMLLVFFPILILGEAYWIISKGCFSILNTFLAVILGGGLGVLWAYIIDKTNLRGLQYFNIGSNREKCTRPSTQRFRCVTYKQGIPQEFITTSGTS
jgi:hypothetical protein